MNGFVSGMITGMINGASAASGGYSFGWGEASGQEARVQVAAEKSDTVGISIMPTLACNHNDRPSVSPGDIAEHALDGNLGAIARDVGAIDAFEAVLDVIGNEALSHKDQP